jgi:hypothetical protein
LSVLIISIIAYFYWRSTSGSGVKVALRRLPAVDAIDEAIGRSVEMGRPVHFTSGRSNLQGTAAAPMLAGMAALDYISKKGSEQGADLIVSMCQPDTYILADSIVREAYTAMGKPEEFKEDCVRFLSGSQFGYVSAVMGTLQREQPAANILIGSFAAESLIFAETASKVGAFQIAGTQNPSQIPFFVVASDYALIGEEIYALDAYLTKDPALLNALASEDLLKVLTVATIILGAILSTAGISLLADLLSGGG